MTVEQDAPKQIVDPLGDGGTMREPGGSARSDRGDNEYALVPRGPASRAPRSRAYSPARASFQTKGSTEAPRASATETAVENDSTSTTMTTGSSAATLFNPVKPQSKRTSYFD